MAAIEEGLPLTDHAVDRVVEYGDADRQSRLPGRGQFLGGHLEGAVSVNQPDGPRVFLFPGADCCSYCSGQAVTHGPQSAGGDPGAGAFEVDELAGPHLVLSHAGYPDSIRIGLVAQGLDHPLGCQGAVRAGFKGGGVVVPPAVDQPPPGLEVGLAPGALGCLERRNQIVQHLAHVPDDGYISLPVLADFGRVDVDVDDPSHRGEVLKAAGHPVVEACAYGHQQVGVLDGAVGGHCAVHAGHSQYCRIGVRYDASRRQGGDHGGTGGSNEFLDLPTGV